MHLLGFYNFTKLLGRNLIYFCVEIFISSPPVARLRFDGVVLKCEKKLFVSYFSFCAEVIKGYEQRSNSWHPNEPSSTRLQANWDGERRRWAKVYAERWRSPSRLRILEYELIMYIKVLHLDRGYEIELFYQFELPGYRWFWYILNSLKQRWETASWRLTKSFRSRSKCTFFILWLCVSETH